MLTFWVSSCIISVSIPLLCLRPVFVYVSSSLNRKPRPVATLTSIWYFSLVFGFMARRSISFSAFEHYVCHCEAFFDKLSA